LTTSKSSLSLSEPLVDDPLVLVFVSGLVGLLFFLPETTLALAVDVFALVDEVLPDPFTGEGLPEPDRLPVSVLGVPVGFTGAGVVVAASAARSVTITATSVGCGDRLVPATASATVAVARTIVMITARLIVLFTLHPLWIESAYSLSQIPC